MAAASLFKQKSQIKTLKKENEKDIFELNFDKRNDIRLADGVEDEDEFERKPCLFYPHKEKSG